MFDYACEKDGFVSLLEYLQDEVMSFLTSRNKTDHSFHRFLCLQAFIDIHNKKVFRYDFLD